MIQITDIIVMGMTYAYEDEYYGDAIKTEHYLVSRNGARMNMDWSPYGSPSREDIRRFIVLGYPNRDKLKSFGPLDSKSLLAYEQRFYTVSIDAVLPRPKASTTMQKAA